jgi:hypothetical protein
MFRSVRVVPAIYAASGGANSNRNKILVNVFNGFLQLVGCNEFSMYQLVCGNAAAPEQVTKNTTVYDGSR